MSAPLFAVDGNRFVPSDHTRGPWDPGAQHGGAPSALLGRTLEALPSAVPMALVRVTVEILRPVPLLPLVAAARIERDGRRVQLVSATLSTVDAEICRATAWRVRIPGRDGAANADAAAGDAPPLPFAGPEASTPHIPESDEPAFHRTGVEMRYARGAFASAGPATAWFRLARPLVEGEVPSPAQRALAAADFGNGVSAVLDWGSTLFMNIDLTLYLHRQPAGEWICLDARTDVGDAGAGVAQSALYDTRGPVGRSLQALLIEPRRLQELTR